MLTQVRQQDESRVAEWESERLGLERDLLRGQSEVRQLLAEVGAGASSGTAVTRLAELQARLAQIEQRLARLRGQMEALQQERLDEAAAKEVLSGLVPAWEAMALDEQARLVRLLVSRVDYDGLQGKASMTRTKDAKDSAGLTALKIGSRVRCTDDGVEGRITWANGISVKVQWDDGEQVTWRRDSLVDRPIDILPPADQEDKVATNPESADAGQGDWTEVPRQEQSPTANAPQVGTTQAEQPIADAAAPAGEPTMEEPVTTSAVADQEQAHQAVADVATPAPVASKRRRDTSTAPKEKKISPCLLLFS